MLSVEQQYRKAAARQVHRRIRQGRELLTSNEAKAVKFYMESAEKVRLLGIPEFTGEGFSMLSAEELAPVYTGFKTA